jgi:hypothetical protein
MSRVGPGQGRVIPRRSVLVLVPGLVALDASRALAQRAAGPSRIGWLGYVSPPDAGLESIRQGTPGAGPRRGQVLRADPALRERGLR